MDALNIPSSEPGSVGMELEGRRVKNLMPLAPAYDAIARSEFPLLTTAAAAAAAAADAHAARAPCADPPPRTRGAQRPGAHCGARSRPAMTGARLAEQSGMIHIGDELLSLDGEVNSRDFPGLLAGPAGGELVLELRRGGAGGGALVQTSLVRAAEAHLEAENALAITLKEISRLSAGAAPLERSKLVAPRPLRIARARPPRTPRARC